MLEITLRLPEALGTLPPEERDFLIRAGLHEAVAARIRQLEAERAQAAEHIKIFEARYGMPLVRFETGLLPTLDSHQAHEDYNDWFFWHSVLAEKERLLASLRQPDLT
ncbi:MAG: hypothetical protein M5U01_41985 [Ardenticatenaceae bacterium]|nr:hypothetical protein [Ardenticatenaceae bacterium]